MRSAIDPASCSVHAAPSWWSATPKSPTAVTSPAPEPQILNSAWLSGGIAGSASGDHAAPSQRSIAGAPVKPSPPTVQIVASSAPQIPHSDTSVPLVTSLHAPFTRRSVVPASPTAHTSAPTPAIQCSRRVPAGSATSVHVAPSQRSITPVESTPAPCPPTA